MLEDARHSQFGTAWWRDSQESRSLRVEQWQTQPQSRGLHFYAPDFALNAATPWLAGEVGVNETPGARPDAQPFPRLQHRAEPSAAEFARLHEEILQRIRAGRFAKVVPMVFEELEFSEPLTADMFTSVLAREFDHQFTYGFAFQGEGMCGVTPELLFSVKEGVLQTMALAGTGRVDGPSLLDDKKERHEHELVIEHIVRELSHWGPADVGTTVERPFGKLKHLYTPIHLDLRQEIAFMDLVVRLHPTAALGGWPRRPAVEWLEQQSFHTTRRRFGAPFGFVEGDDMRCLVAIRGLQWEGKRAWLSSGCGVVEGSESLREWKELELKRAATCAMLGLEL